MSPKGQTFKQQKVFELINYEHIVLLCGHYEGVDQRVLDMFIDEEISIGDYVLTGGELPAMVVCDCLARYVDGVISDGSLVDESFSDGMLEYPQYTRPAVYNGVSVPEVLLSGNHAKIDEWRKEESKKITQKRRPDLLK
jgi:tRNA (guanine37-N1)-methyltransferase